VIIQAPPVRRRARPVIVVVAFAVLYLPGVSQAHTTAGSSRQMQLSARLSF
jgi:hypothetical protein